MDDEEQRLREIQTRLDGVKDRAIKKLTTGELASVKRLAALPKNISYRWLSSMVNEIRLWRSAGNALVGLVDTVENRCMAADGPVTPTLREMTEDEFCTIYQKIIKVLK